MPPSLLTPSKITAWLECPHSLALSRQVDAGTLTVEPVGVGAFSRLVMAKGLEHERACLAAYEAQGCRILIVPDREDRETFEAWVRRVGDPFSGDHDVIYQLPMVHNGVRGIADFLIKVEHPITGAVSWEPVDAKLARAEAKPGHVLQLCFYADAIEAVTGVMPHNIHIWLGSGTTETLRAADFGAYWRRIQSQLVHALDDPAQATTAEPCLHCDYCQFAGLCQNQWRADDSLIYVAGVTSRDRRRLTDGGVDSLVALSEFVGTIHDLAPERLRRMIDQATLQALARNDADVVAPHRLTQALEGDPTWGQGFAQMPKPDDGDIFLDYEGHPFWTASAGLFFLFGWIERRGASWSYECLWAHNEAEEKAATATLIQFLADRRETHPGMHVYHYNHTERSSLERLANTYSVGESVLDRLVYTGLFVDLYTVTKNALQAGVESYGLKHMERLAGYERGHDIDAGAGAVLSYEAWMTSKAQTHLDAIAAYNEDDVRATMALRDWLLTERSADLPWRDSFLTVEEPEVDLDALVEDARTAGEDLLADLLGYWQRERRASNAQLMISCARDDTELFRDTEAVGGLEFLGIEPAYDTKGEAKTPVARFRFPEQVVTKVKRKKGPVLFVTSAGPGFSSISTFDENTRELTLNWNARCDQLGELPAAIVLNGYVWPGAKEVALEGFVRGLIADGQVNPATLALLRQETPKFDSDVLPGAIFSDDVEDMCGWIGHLAVSYVAVQGPPGTGKTFRGAHLIRRLVLDGKRVGITAMSHAAIDNLVAATVALFQKTGDLEHLRAVQKMQGKSNGKRPGVTTTTDNAKAAKPDFNVVAGTTWLFATPEMLSNPVDVLFVDEAGQLALVDALAASISAKNLILLGDPLQLAQVALAKHPEGAEASVLEHVLKDATTMPPNRGVFIYETRRMHPDVCDFISQQIYEGRLSSYIDCARQTTIEGTGLRWLKAQHTDRTTSSVEEAAMVLAEISRLMGTPWTNQKGETAALTPSDFMVVAPYNDQVDLIAAALASDPTLADVPVGTVDKFQGREAAVVFFTMTTSSSADMTRGPDFLFSRNRLNVAISRARCLAYLVCTEALLNVRASSVDDMRLISTLAAFVEMVP